MHTCSPRPLPHCSARSCSYAQAVLAALLAPNRAMTAITENGKNFMGRLQAPCSILSYLSAATASPPSSSLTNRKHAARREGAISNYQLLAPGRRMRHRPKVQMRARFCREATPPASPLTRDVTLGTPKVRNRPRLCEKSSASKTARILFPSPGKVMVLLEG